MSKRSIVHVEIPANTAQESSAFYAALCGWQFTTDEQFNYTMFEGGNIGGGFTIKENLAENPHFENVLIYLDSDDVETDLKHVEKLGGKVLVPVQDVGEFGQFGIFQDPAGNKIAFWKELAPTDTTEELPLP